MSSSSKYRTLKQSVYISHLLYVYIHTLTCMYNVYKDIYIFLCINICIHTDASRRIHISQIARATKWSYLIHHHTDIEWYLSKCCPKMWWMITKHNPQYIHTSALLLHGYLTNNYISFSTVVLNNMDWRENYDHGRYYIHTVPL